MNGWNVVGVAAALTLGNAAFGQWYSWVNPAGGTWQSAANWSPAVVPGATAMARIEIPGEYVVTSEGSLNVRGVFVLNPDATLRVINQITCPLFRVDGVFEIGNMNVPTTCLLLGSDQNSSISGTGRVVLRGANASGAILRGSVFEIGPALTITGSGSVRDSFQNDGTIVAEHGTIDTFPQNATNNGAMRAAADGTLRIDGSLTQSGGGLIEATPGGLVEILGPLVSGGTVRAQENGRVRLTRTNATLERTSLEGRIDVAANIQAVLRGNTTLNGEIRVPESGATDFTSLRIDPLSNVAAVTGSGVIRLASPVEAVPPRVVLQTQASATIGSDIQVIGCGRIQGSSIVNHGVIASDGEGAVMNIQAGVVNAGVLEARAESTLQMATTFPTDQTLGGVIRANEGGLVELSAGTSIQGGRIMAATGGTVRVTTTPVTVAGVTIDGRFDIRRGAEFILSQLGSTPATLVNNGLITVGAESPAGGAARFRVSAAQASLGGTGDIVLAGDGTNELSAVLAFQAGAPVVVGPAVGIRGVGSIQGRFRNAGTISADQRGQDLVISGGDNINDRTMRAALSGRLVLRGSPMTQGPAGEIHADGGRVEFQSTSLLRGGTLRANEGFAVVAAAQATLHLDTVRLVGTLIAEAGSTINPIPGQLPAPPRVYLDQGRLQLQSGATSSAVLLGSQPVFEGSGSVMFAGSLAAPERFPRAEQGIETTPGVRLAGSGRILGRAVIGGPLDPGIEPGFVGRFDFFGPTVALADTSRYVVDLGVEPGLRDSITSTGTVFLAGRAEVRPMPPYEPQLGDAFRIITAANVDGAFASISGPAPDGARWVAVVRQLPDQTDAVDLVLTCRGDFDGSGQIDFFDYLDFANAFAAGSPRADFDGNGQVDFFDYLEFVAAFSNGC
jgi:hypothetical protein